MKHLFYFTRVKLMLTVGIFSLQSISSNLPINTRSCSFTGPYSTFCNLNVLTQACVGGTLNVAGINVVSGNVFFGNTCRVDEINGDDTIGNRNGAPFKTIGAALTDALPGDVVWVFPGTYNETLTIPDGIVLSGICYGSTYVQQLGVTTPTDLITVGQGCIVNNINFLVTAAADVPIRGIVLTGNTTGAASTLSNGQIEINTTAAGLTTSNVYGVSYSSAGNPAFIDATIVFSSIVITESTGIVRGVLVDSTNQLDIVNAQVQAFGVSNAIAVETNAPGAIVKSAASIFNGTTADISQTSGTLSVGTVSLVNSNANGLGFSTLVYPNTFIWGDPNFEVGGGKTLYVSRNTVIIE